VVEAPCDSVIVPDGAALSAYQYFENVRNFLVAVEDLGLPTFEASDLEQVCLVISLTLIGKSVCWASSIPLLLYLIYWGKKRRQNLYDVIFWVDDEPIWCRITAFICMF
jgi:hypothetical protein